MYPIFESSLSKPYPIGWHIPLLIFQVEPYRIGHNPSPTPARTRTHPSGTLFFLYKNVVFPAQAEYSYFFADFRLKIFLYYS